MRTRPQGKTQAARRLPALLAGAALAFSFALAGCSAQQGDKAAEQQQDALAGLEVSNARLVLPAVKGRPAAVYFDLAYDGERAFSIRRVDVEGAGSAMLHENVEQNGVMKMMESLPIPVSKGARISFVPGGRHVMVFDLSPDIAPGDKVSVTLTVSGGDSFSFPAKVHPAGEDR